VEIEQIITIIEGEKEKLETARAEFEHERSKIITHQGFRKPVHKVESKMTPRLQPRHDFIVDTN